MKNKLEQVVIKNVSQLAAAFQNLVARHHRPGPLKRFTPKEKGQISLFMRAVGTEHAYDVMRWAIAHWGDLRIEVRRLKGFNVPPLPQPGMLLLHWDVALREYQEQCQSSHGPTPSATAPLLHADTAAKLEAKAAEVKLTSELYGGSKKLNTTYVVE